MAIDWAHVLQTSLLIYLAVIITVIVHELGHIIPAIYHKVLIKEVVIGNLLHIPFAVKKTVVKISPFIFSGSCTFGPMRKRKINYNVSFGGPAANLLLYFIMQFVSVWVDHQFVQMLALISFGSAFVNVIPLPRHIASDANMFEQETKR